MEYCKLPDHRTDTPNVWVPSPSVRRYLYRVFLALGPILSAHGVLTGEDFTLYAGLAGVVLDVPLALALANVPKE